MRALLTAAILALAGCSDVSFRAEPGRPAASVWILPPELNPEAFDVDRPALAKRIRAAAEEEIRDGGMAIAMDEESADLVVHCTVDSFRYSPAACFGWRSSRDDGWATLDARFNIREPGGARNEARTRVHVLADGYGSGNLVERRENAVVRRLAGVY